MNRRINGTLKFGLVRCVDGKYKDYGFRVLKDKTIIALISVIEGECCTETKNCRLTKTTLLMIINDGWMDMAVFRTRRRLMQSKQRLSGKQMVMSKRIN